jgi:hypothetical protein
VDFRAVLMSSTGFKVSLSSTMRLTAIVTTDAAAHVAPFVIVVAALANGFNGINNTHDSDGIGSAVFSNNARDITEYEDVVLVKYLVLFYRPTFTTAIVPKIAPNNRPSIARVIARMISHKIAHKIAHQITHQITLPK